jgi:acyl dehydratase
MEAAGDLVERMSESRSMIHIPTLKSLQQRVGEELAVGEWLTVDQPMIDKFAEATGDHQWIHIDPARAAQGPFGTTIAHGFLTLSLLPKLAESAIKVDDVRMGVNYGLNRVRFPAPVPVGSRLRARMKLLAYEPIDGGAQLTMQVTMERDGGDKPVCVAETLSRRFT